MFRKLLEFAEGEAVVGVAESEAEDDDSSGDEDAREGGGEEAKSNHAENEDDEAANDECADEDDEDDEEEVEEVDASTYLMDSDVEYDAPKNPAHSFCRLCPGIVFKSEAAVNDHVHSKAHLKREAEYKRVQKEFNARVFGGAEETESDDDDDDDDDDDRQMPTSKRGDTTSAAASLRGDTPIEKTSKTATNPKGPRGNHVRAQGAKGVKKDANGEERTRQKGRIKRKKEDARLKKLDEEGQSPSKKLKLEERIALKKEKFAAKKARRLARRAEQGVAASEEAVKKGSAESAE